MNSASIASTDVLRMVCRNADARDTPRRRYREESRSEPDESQNEAAEPFPLLKEGGGGTIPDYLGLRRKLVCEVPNEK